MYRKRNESTRAGTESPERREVLLGLASGLALGALAMTGKPAAAESAPGTDITGPEALERARTGEVTIVDVRSPQEWRQTGLPAGAKAVTIHDPEGLAGFVAALKQSVGGDLDRPVALICARGNRSTLAQNALQAAGFTRILNIKEGMLGSASGPGWLARDLPLESCNC